MSFVEEQSWDVFLRPIDPFSKKVTRITPQGYYSQLKLKP